VLSTFRMLAELPPDSLGAYVISMARSASDVLAVVLLQRECGVKVCLRWAHAGSLSVSRFIGLGAMHRHDQGSSAPQCRASCQSCTFTTASDCKRLSALPSIWLAACLLSSVRPFLYLASLPALLPRALAVAPEQCAARLLCCCAGHHARRASVRDAGRSCGRRRYAQRALLECVVPRPHQGRAGADIKGAQTDRQTGTIARLDGSVKAVSVGGCGQLAKRQLRVPWALLGRSWRCFDVVSVASAGWHQPVWMLTCGGGGPQEVMVGYSDSGKDAGRMAAAWALYEVQEKLVKVCLSAFS
jgi:Phosphoenolpyruvate carboxylase